MLLVEVSSKPVPTFAGFRFDGASMSELAKLADGLPNKTSKGQYHVTLLYSKKPITFEARGRLETPISVKAKKYDLFTGQNDEKCLVLVLDADEIIARHKQVMADTGASYDHPNFHPHVTLSYDVGKDFDMDSLPDIKDLPELSLNQEYSQKLNFNWAKNNLS